MIIQIQKSEVETAASPAGPILVPTQNASTDENSVIKSDEATAGLATRRMVWRSESRTRCAASRPSPTATVAMPSWISTGSDGAGGRAFSVTRSTPDQRSDFSLHSFFHGQESTARG